MPPTPDPRRPADEDGGGFFSRWSQRKQQARQGAPLAEPVPAPPPAVPAAPVTTAAPTTAAPTTAKTLNAPVTTPATATTTAPAVPPPPAPTAADLAALDARDPAADFSRFIQPGVDGALKNAALKKLFSDPHFNVMDGLDTYIDDYGLPDPLPPGMLEQMAGTDFLGLRQPDPTPEEDAAAQTFSPADPLATAATPPTAPSAPAEPAPAPAPAAEAAPTDTADPASPRPSP